MASPRFARWRVYPGKRGPLARAAAVHAAADAHAQANPRIRARVPATEAALSRMLGMMARDLQWELTDYVTKRILAGVRLPSGVQNLRDELRAMADEWLGVARPNVRDSIEACYTSGKRAVSEALGDRGESMRLNFSKPDRYAMQAILNDTMRDLAGQTQYMLTGAVAVLRSDGGALIRTAIAKGTNPRRLAKQIEADLVARGYQPGEALKEYVTARNKHRHPVTGALPMRRVRDWREAVAVQAEFGEFRFIDRAGREWDMGDYSRMLARTKLSIARNEGAVLAMTDADVHHYTISDHGTESEVCEQYEGETFWTGEGDSLGYEQAPTLPPYHPNCWHYVIPAVLVKPKGKR